MTASLQQPVPPLRAADLFESLQNDCQKRDPLAVAVCWPCSVVALSGALEAARAGMISPYLLGPAATLRAIATSAELDLGSCVIVDVATEEESVERAVDLCRTKKAEALMKGSLHTDTLMHIVLEEKSGLRTSRKASHVFVMEAPLYPRPLLITDAVINIYPSLEDKVDILNNAIVLAHALGIQVPKVAVLSAVETVNPRILSTLDAAALCKMAERGQITGAVLDGPLAFDTAISKEAAQRKGIRSPVVGDVDILLVPDLESGNMLAKELEYLGGAHLAGIVVGTKVPIILTSRADSAESRMASCAVASALASCNRSPHL